MSSVLHSNLVSPTIKSGVKPGDCNGRQSWASTRRELVTVAVSQADYDALKAIGGPHPDDITTALKNYVDLVRKTGWYPEDINFGWGRGPVIHFLTAIPKDLAEEIRNLPGRFDGHTIEAVRIFFGEETDGLDDASRHLGLSPQREDSAVATLGALRLLASRVLDYILFP